MMDRELCRAMGCRMREDDGSHCSLKDLAGKCSLFRFWLAKAHFASLAGKGSLSEVWLAKAHFLSTEKVHFPSIGMAHFLSSRGPSLSAIYLERR